jgi:RNA polymerase sigma-70 factor (sigma-E family)
VDLLRTERARAEFESFVATHSEWLLRIAYLITWDLAEAEDLTQECLLRVARRWPKVRRMSHPKAYARRILVNLSLDGARGRGRRGIELGRDDASLEHPDSLALQHIATIEDRDELATALGALPQRQRLILVLRYFADLSEEQTAKAVGCSLGTVKSTSSRALTRLRETMEAESQDQSARTDLPNHATTHTATAKEPSDDRAT